MATQSPAPPDVRACYSCFYYRGPILVSNKTAVWCRLHGPTADVDPRDGCESHKRCREPAGRPPHRPLSLTSCTISACATRRCPTCTPCCGRSGAYMSSWCMLTMSWAACCGQCPTIKSCSAYGPGYGPRPSCRPSTRSSIRRRPIRASQGANAPTRHGATASGYRPCRREAPIKVSPDPAILRAAATSSD